MYVVHPFTVHAADEHRGRTPRFMAQAPVVLTSPLTPASSSAAWHASGRIARCKRPPTSPARAPSGTITTSREDFRALAAGHRVVPVTRKVLADSETPLSAYRKLAANRPGTFLLESAENGRSWSRWSFIGAGAPSALTVRDGEAVWLGVTPQDAPRGGDPLQALRATLELLKTEHVPGLPPLSSGLVGFFAYDMVRRLERLPDRWPSTTSGCPTCCCCWPPTSPPSTTTRAPSR